MLGWSVVKRIISVKRRERDQGCPPGEGRVEKRGREVERREQKRKVQGNEGEFLLKYM